MANQALEDATTMKRVALVVVCLAGLTAALIVAVSIIT